MNQAISLQGDCFVTHTEALEYRPEGTWKWAQAIGVDDQARSLSLFCIELSEGRTPWLACGESDAVLYSLEGACKLRIGEREFELRPGTGAHVRPGERFCLQNQQPGKARLLLSYCPRREGLAFDDDGDFHFDQRFPTRTVETGRSPTQA
ncbi:MAG: hypothetical protein HKN58_00425, partial [Xanthomonadales bacterium]|nr:hypothetical protein [Xanthomonadales bacterium]